MLLAIVTFASAGKIITYLAMLSVLVVLHEYGHFIVARWNGVRVNEFAVGMGPKLFGWVSPRSGTLYSFRALPIGGYCLMEGEDNKTSEAEQQREFRRFHPKDPKSVNFQSKSTWQRLAIVVAGPFANFILCYLILLVGAFAFGVPSQKIAQAIVESVVPNSPAAHAGLQPGDRVVAVAIDGVAVTDASRLIDTIHASLGKHITVTYDRNGIDQTIHVVPAPCPQNAKQGCIGFAPTALYLRAPLPETLDYVNAQFLGAANNAVLSVTMLFTHFTQVANQTAGPVGIGQAAMTIQDFGWGPYFAFAALISFALGMFNLLPFPALDGGRALFIVAEMVRGKPVAPEKEAMVHAVGIVVLLTLMLLRTYGDVARIVAGKGLL